MTLGTRLLTWFRGEAVGTDSFGNRYYRERGSRKLRRGGHRPPATGDYEPWIPEQ